MKENQILALKILFDIADKLNKEYFDQTPDILERLTILLLAILHHNSNSPPPELKDQQEDYKKAYSKVIKLIKHLSNEEVPICEKSNQIIKEFAKNK
jgi:hypothetical protein